MTILHFNLPLALELTLLALGKRAWSGSGGDTAFAGMGPNARTRTRASARAITELRVALSAGNLLVGLRIWCFGLHRVSGGGMGAAGLPLRRARHGCAQPLAPLTAMQATRVLALVLPIVSFFVPAMLVCQHQHKLRYSFLCAVSGVGG